MKVGKLSNEELQEVILNKLHKVREDVLIGPGIGLDCAVVDFGESSLVISSDPITGASNNIGSIAVGINCNDIAASGGEAGLHIVVIGESQTRDHLGAYGYARNTTPWLLRQKGSPGWLLFDRFDIPAAQIESNGVGPLAPRASNLTDAGRQKNRRVEVFTTPTR